MGKGISKGKAEDDIDDFRETGHFHHEEIHEPLYRSKHLQFRDINGNGEFKFRIFDGKGIEDNDNYGILPVHTIHRCFLFCEPKVLFNIFSTCRLFYAVSSTPLFWKEYYRNSFPEDFSPKDGTFQRQEEGVHVAEKEKNKERLLNWKELFYERQGGTDIFYRKKYGQLLDDFPLEENNSKLKTKVVLLGYTMSGKSSFFERFVHDNYFDSMESTIGAAFGKKTLFYETSSGGTKASIVLEIWDTAGDERYKSLAPMYYRGSEGQIIFYDVTDRQSFEKAKLLVKDIRRNVNFVNIVFVGTKTDLVEYEKIERKVTVKEVKEFCEKEGGNNEGYGGKVLRGKVIPFCECSAKKNQNMFKVVGLLIDALFEQKKRDKI